MIPKIVAGIVAIFLISVGYFYWSQNKNQAQKISVPSQNIRIGNVGEYSIFNIIAKQNGYFEKNGLNAEVKEYSSGPAAMQDLLAGKLDVTVAAEFVGVRNIFTSNDIRILSEVSKQESFSLIARKDKGITAPKDLKGKTLGVTRKGSGEFFLGKFLDINDLKITDVKIEDLSPADMSAKIEAGTLDAAVIFDPHIYNLQNKLGANAVVFSVQAKEKTFALLYSTQNYINNNPKIIEQYLKSLKQAEDFAKSNPEESMAIVGRNLNYSPEYVKRMWGKVEFRLSLDQEVLLIMEDQAAWVIANKLTNKTEQPNFLNYIYFKGLTTINPNAVSIVH